MRTIKDKDYDYIVDMVEHIERQATKSGIILKELKKQWDSIKMESIDKDNMEFKCTITCFQKEAIENAFERLIGKGVGCLTDD